MSHPSTPNGQDLNSRSKLCIKDEYDFALEQIVSPKLLNKDASEFSLLIQKELLTTVFVQYLREPLKDEVRQEILKLYEGLQETLDHIYQTIWMSKQNAGNV